MINTDTENSVEERQTSKFDYQVEQVPMHLPNGNPTRYFANVRTDSQEVLGIVTDRYEILQNSYLFETAESVFKTSGFGNFERRTICTNGGARVRAIYNFPNTGIKLSNGNDMTLRLTVQNSFDGSLRASFQVGLLRLICTNGMLAPYATLGMTKKHTSTLDPEVIGESFKRSINAFNKSTDLFNDMINTRIDQRKGIQILESLEKSKIMSERMRKGIESIWVSPTHREDSDRNLFNLYNATTQYLTHSVESKRFELADRVNTGVINAFTKNKHILLNN